MTNAKQTGQTIAEKIISSHAGKDVYHDELVIARVDGAMATDTTAPFTIRSFKEMGGKSVWDPDRCFFVLDHAAPSPNERISNLHAMIRAFAREQGCTLFDANEGICHQLMVEKGIVQPGRLFVGADSHTCTYGGIDAFGVGVGATDLAAVLLTGHIWLRVPRTVKIQLNGRLSQGVQGKDIILFVLEKIGVSGATYMAMEFCGDAIAHLPLADRLTVANMAIEAGAKTGFIHPAGLELSDSDSMVFPDEDAVYHHSLTIDAPDIEPMVSQPHSPANALPVAQAAKEKIHYAFIGTCVNGRLTDLRTAARILKGASIHPDVRLVIGPASKQIFLEATKDGTVETLTAAGATFIPPGCGPCVGTHLGVPGDHEVVISTANRNFKGRMGNPKAKIYLASPATVAASAREGSITDPRPYL